MSIKGCGDRRGEESGLAIQSTVLTDLLTMVCDTEKLGQTVSPFSADVDVAVAVI